MREGTREKKGVRGGGARAAAGAQGEWEGAAECQEARTLSLPARVGEGAVDLERGRSRARQGGGGGGGGEPRRWLVPAFSPLPARIGASSLHSTKEQHQRCSKTAPRNAPWTWPLRTTEREMCVDHLPEPVAGDECELAHIATAKMSLRVQLLTAEAKLPTRGSAFAAGYDLCAAYRGVVPARGKALIKTDIAIAVPPGTYGRVGACFVLCAPAMASFTAPTVISNMQWRTEALTLPHTPHSAPTLLQRRGLGWPSRMALTLARA